MDVPEQMIEILRSATADVFERMVFRKVVALDPLPREPRRPGVHVVATVAFTGHRSGAVAFSSGAEVAREIAGAMLGMTAAEVNGEMPDAIGEIANMIAGSFRTRMAAVEAPCTITMPTVTVGSDFITRYVAEASRIVCPFEMDGQAVYVELVLNHE